MYPSRLRPALLFLWTFSLLAASFTGALAGPQDAATLSLRILLPVAVFAWALARPREASLLALFLSPLAPVALRSIAATGSFSVGEHLVCAAMAGGSLRFTLRGAPAAERAWLPAALLGFGSVVLLSFLSVLRQYAGAGVPPLDFLSESLPLYFRMPPFFYLRDDLLVVHHTILTILGVCWYLHLSQPALRGDGRGIALVLVGSAVVACSVGIAQSFWHFAEVPFFARAQRSLFRVSATLQDPNTFGVYLAGLFWLGLVLALRWAGSRILATAWVLLVGYCLAESVSRSSWIGLAATFPVALAVVWRFPPALGFQERPRWLRAATAAVGVVGVLCGGLFGTVTYFDLGRSITKRDATSATDMALLSLNARRPVTEVLPARIQHWNAALSVWREHPILGAGVGRYALEKLRRPGEILDRTGVFGRKRVSIASATGSGTQVTCPEGCDFSLFDVLPGDTIESMEGAWGPYEITLRRSKTELVLDRPIPTGAHAYIIRHPGLDLKRRAHAHRSSVRGVPKWTTAHNQFLGALADLGLLGFAMFLAIPVALFLDVRSALGSADENRRLLAMSAGLGLLAMFVAALAQDPLVVKEMHHVYWALAALILPTRSR